MANTENNNVGSKLNQPHKKEQKRMKTINLLSIQLQKLIKKTSKKINEMINTRIQLETGNAEYKLPKIVCDSIETIYQTPFRLLGKFGEKQFKKSVRHILNILEDNSNKQKM